MSQEKVDRYKKEKANRQKILRKQKIERIVGKTVGAVLLVVIVGWLGYSAYDKIQSRPVETTYVDMTAVEDYMSSLSEAE